MSLLPSALHIAHRTLHITDCTLHILQPAVGEQDQENPFVRRGQPCDGDVLNSRVSSSWCEDIDGDLHFTLHLAQVTHCTHCTLQTAKCVRAGAKTLMAIYNASRHERCLQCDDIISAVPCNLQDGNCMVMHILKSTYNII